MINIKLIVSEYQCIILSEYHSKQFRYAIFISTLKQMLSVIAPLCLIFYILHLANSQNPISMIWIKLIYLCYLFLKFIIYQKNITGHFSVAAKLNAAWASPSLAAPSPKYTMTHLPFFARLKAYAEPTAEKI